MIDTTNMEGPYGPLPGIRYYNVAWKPIYGRMEMPLPEAGTRRQAVEAFVLWTREIEESDGVFQTLEENLCSCAVPTIADVGAPQRSHDCPWCELRKAFGLLGGV